MSLTATLKLSRRALLGLALASGLAGALMSAALTFGLEAWANHDNNPATDGVPRAFSYNGSLEWDGVALNGPVEMTFQLFGAPDAPPEAALWSETQRLTAYSGKFGAELGADPLNPVTETLYDAGPLWLGVSVQRLDQGGAPLGEPITLDNKQKINPVPYALWSTQSSNLNVAGNATIGQDLRIMGTLYDRQLKPIVPIRPTLREYFQYESYAGSTVNQPISDDDGLELLRTNSACFLTTVQFADDNDEDDVSQCAVYVQNNRWHIYAYTRANDTGERTMCVARCLRWD